MNVRRLLSLLILPLALAACDQAALKDFRFPWDKEAAVEVPTVAGPPAVSPLENPIEVAGATPVAMATADARTLNESAFVIEGPGNAWRVEVAGDKARYLRPGAREAAVTVRRLVYARGVEYVGRLGDAPFALTVLGEACKTPGMDRAWPLAARLKAGGKTIEGCATPAAGAPARTFTVAPPAPAKPRTPTAAPAAPKPAVHATEPAPKPAPTTPADQPPVASPEPAPVAPSDAEPAPKPEPAAAAEPSPVVPPIILPVPATQTETAPAAATQD